MTTGRARIELLVRSEAGDGFRVTKVESSLAYRQARPQRIPEAQYEVAALRSNVRRSTTYVVKNRLTEKYIELSEAEKFLWDRMNGRTSIEELGVAYVLEFGAFDFDIIHGLIDKLQRAELLTMRPVSRLREVLARNRRNPAARAAEATLRALERLTVGSRSAHEAFARVYRYGAFLVFSPVGVGLLVLVTALGVKGAREIWNTGGDISAGFGQHPVLALVLVKLFFFLTLISHQMLHALALVHYGRRVKEFGFTMLHGFLPTFYADTTDVFMGSRRARIVTGISGPLVHLFLGSLYIYLASQCGPGLMKSFLVASAIIQSQSLFFSLYPFCFLEMDGYHVLVDWLGLPRLKSESVAFVRHTLWGRLGGGMGLSREEAVFVGYVVLSTVSIAAFVVLNVWFLVHTA
ncbi:MAG TPA: PqqD family protein [Methylomirabilota bacterium]|nr:PqqD family protein [Methylomirabilota bacterium]